MKLYCSASLSILVLLLITSCENRYRKNVAVHSAKNETPSDTAVGKQKMDISKDAYQVSSDEYDEFFATRYGLLYQKFSEIPFTGQIVTIENGSKGKFVIADESWRNGKKDGASTRWFSNGVKMYERNYSDGKWNGTVTRWWPNGQKMYVRAYSDGVRHGEEATWRSDGTPIKTAANLTEVAPSTEIENDDEEKTDSDAVTAPLEFEEPANEMTDSLPVVSPDPSPVVEMVIEEPVQPQEQPFSVESFPSDLPEISEQDALPEPEVSPQLPGLPIREFEADAPMPSQTEAGLPFPALPESPSPAAAVSDFPALPGIESQPMDSSELPALPGFPADNGDLPPMPVEDNALPGLPPLPEPNEGSANELPPLPPLP